MKYIKIFEEYIESIGDKLTGDDKKVFDVVNELCESFYNFEFFDKSAFRQRIDPIITGIIDQNQNNQAKKFPNDKQFYIFINNGADGKGYIEIETGISNSGKFIAENAEPSSHGHPASYGKEIYSYDRKTGKVTFDKDFFSFVLR
jgi:hypothetical protein